MQWRVVVEQSTVAKTQFNSGFAVSSCFVFDCLDEFGTNALALCGRMDGQRAEGLSVGAFGRFEIEMVGRVEDGAEEIVLWVDTDQKLGALLE